MSTENLNELLQIYEPQNPLYHKEKDAYFYPLTSENQVVMNDGRRLNAALEDVIENSCNRNNISSISGEVITVSDSAEAPLQGLKLYGKTTQNGTPTPDAPIALESVGDDGRVDVTVCSKNLFDNSLFKESNYSVWFHLKLKPNTRYTFSTNCDVTANALLFFLSGRVDAGASSTVNGVFVNKPITQISDNDGYVSVVFRALGTTMPSNYQWQLEEGTQATAYEPYNAQVISISTPNGLPGIPVTSGGNYTDSNGQRWICDEVDFEKGVYVQRVGKSTLNKENTWYWNASKNCAYCSIPNAIKLDNTNQTERLVSGDKYVGTSWVRLGQADAEYHCSMYYSLSFVAIHDKDCASVDEFLAKLGDNTIEVQYMLATPIETVLPAEQLAAFAALHTNCPNTTIFNNKNADMSISYATPHSMLPITGGNVSKIGVPDPVKPNDATPKKYVDEIDNKIDELSRNTFSKSQVVNNFTTTEEGFVADARALKALNDTVNKITRTTVQTDIANNPIYISKVGRIVWLHWNAIVTAPKSAWTDIVRIPTDYEPYSNEGLYYLNATNVNNSLYIGTSGRLQFTSSVAVDDRATFDAIYFTVK